MCEHLYLVNLMRRQPTARLRFQQDDARLNTILAGCVCKDVDWMQDMDESELVWQDLPNVTIFQEILETLKGSKVVKIWPINTDVSKNPTAPSIMVFPDNEGRSPPLNVNLYVPQCTA